MNQTRDNGSKRIGLTNTLETAIALLRPVITGADGLPVSRHMGKFYASMNFTRNQSVPMRMGSRVLDKRLACCNDGIFKSIKSYRLGRESNSLEDVESGLIHSAQSVYTEYPDPGRGDLL